jgi:Mannosylglycerate hydrolase MGH1-like glycoside hydrolase domain
VAQRARDPEQRLDALHASAVEVLRTNWTGTNTLPSPHLYPHQWNWDSGFISIGNSWHDQARARQELRTLFDAQWASGKVPQIVFNPSVSDEAYFPGPAFWQSSTRSAAAPRSVETSGISQPPLHARAALEIHRHAHDRDESIAFLTWLYPRLVAQHDYFARDRDPTGIGLASIVHPWESGLDNSPTWDRDLAELVIPPGALPPYTRHDLDHADPADRPTNEAYDRFIYLAVRYRDSGYDDSILTDTVPFTIAGPLFNAIYLWSTHALVEIAEIVGADPGPHRAAADRIHLAMQEHLWDQGQMRYGAIDVRTMERATEDTIVGFAPLLDPALPHDRRMDLITTMRSTCFHPDGPEGFVIPSFDLLGADFDRRRYWRGPIWINTNWLLWSGLHQHGHDPESDDLLGSCIALVERSGFREYFDPIDGVGYGSDGFAWSAALTIDLIERHRGVARHRLIDRLAAWSTMLDEARPAT